MIDFHQWDFICHLGCPTSDPVTEYGCGAEDHVDPNGHGHGAGDGNGRGEGGGIGFKGLGDGAGAQAGRGHGLGKGQGQGACAGTNLCGEDRCRATRLPL